MDEGRARLDDQQAAQVLQVLPEAPAAQLGRRHVRDLLRRHLLLHQADRSAGRRMGPVARLGQGDLREAGHPRGRAQVPGRRHRPVRVRGRLPPQPRRPREAGRAVHRHGHRPARVPRAGQGVLRHRHPAQRQQVRRPQLGGVVGRLVHLRPARRRGRDAAAGLLPHQRREHGPVRADADHRRRGLQGPLHRGLLGAHLHHRLAALRRGRDRGQARRPASPTPPSRTGRTTSSTWSPSGPRSRPRATWSGSTATSAPASP